MLTGVERLVDLIGPREVGLTGASLDEVEAAVLSPDTGRLEATDGHFAAVAREGQTVRLARTLGLPLRYFVAKRYHGPYLVVADRIDRLFEYCQDLKIGWQFDPLYTRMVPAHYLVEIDQVGCPDPNPRYHRFFSPEVAKGPEDVRILGENYVRAALRIHQELARRGARTARRLPSSSPGALTAVRSSSWPARRCKSLAATRIRCEPTRSIWAEARMRLRPSVGSRELGLEDQWERISLDGVVPDLEEAIATIEDYHPAGRGVRGGFARAA